MASTNKLCASLSTAFCILPLAFCFVALTATSAMGQATISTGAIAGTVSDPSGAVIPGARIVVTSQSSGGQITLSSTGVGTFNSGALIPGEYTVRISCAGFQSIDVPVTVQVGVISSVEAKLEVGATQEVVEVSAAALAVNAEQATVQGVLTTNQIESLPFNNRNFLDLAQLEPGVQIQDGNNLDPTKGGFVATSIGGRMGSSTRIELDGQDISDETVGATVTNISPSAIQEFSISQSSLDLSTELTSTGAVNVVSRSGSNSYHGDLFYLFRGNQIAANFPGGQDLPYQRNYAGGRVGGPFLKDKLFFFLSLERVKQDLSSPLVFAPPLDVFNGYDPTPFRETLGMARLDWQIKPNTRFFYRLNYDHNKGITNFGYGYSNYSLTNNTPAHVWGVDFNTGAWNHSLRVSYLKFVSRVDPKAASPVVVVPGVTIKVGGFWSGPNQLGEQLSIQQNLAAKYDGSRMIGKHTLRYGVSLNRIRSGGFASMVIAPTVGGRAAGTAYANTDPYGAGGSTNPLNYPLNAVTLGNGLGYWTEIPAFNELGGGLHDNRFQAYFGDSWKVKPYLTINAGLRYVRDTGRTISDLAPLTCSQIDPNLIAAAAAGGFPITTCPAGGLLMNMFGPNLGGRVRQDNNNFGPTLGFAWDMFHNGKTVIRGGAGLYYENSIFVNTIGTRSNYLPKGLLWNLQGVCPSTNFIFPISGMMDVAGPPWNIECGKAIGPQISAIKAISEQYQSESLAAGPSYNPAFVGNVLAVSGMLAPNYRTPYSYQMNIGVQRELSQGIVLTADYVRNVNLHYLLGYDTNHVGDARYLNVDAARAAIATTLAVCGVATIEESIANCPNFGQPATMADYAFFGLGSGVDINGGRPWYLGITGAPVAFGGINADVGSNGMAFPIGRSVYNAMQLSLRASKVRPVRFLKNLNLQASYTLSRFDTMTGYQDIQGGAWDSAQPTRYSGPATFDRTHQFAFGMVLEFPKFAKLAIIDHLNSPFATTLSVWTPGRLDEIFHTDFTGDGTAADILPGTNIGSFGRGISDLAAVINNYNSTVAGKLTPAGQALVNAGLMTEDQLIRLGAVADRLDPPVPGYMTKGWLNNTDLRVSFPIRIKERLTIEPGASIYNLFNVANFGVHPYCANNRTGGGLCGAIGNSALPNTIGYTTRADADPMRAYQSPTLFNLGSARQAEFALRITF